MICPHCKKGLKEKWKPKGSGKKELIHIALWTKPDDSNKIKSLICRITGKKIKLFQSISAE